MLGRGMQIVDLGSLGSLRLLVFAAAYSLGMVQRAGCHVFPFLFGYFQGNDNQLLISISDTLHETILKTHIREEPIIPSY
jgi:hypothetical protein